MELTLHQTAASGPLLPSRLGQALARLATVRGSEPTPRATMRGQELRIALTGELDDPACCGFHLDFAGQGQRVRGAAHGPSAAALAWALHALSAALKCTLHDATEGRDVDAQPGACRAAAVTYLAAYEAEVSASRAGTREDDASDFLSWLAREEHVVLADDSTALAAAFPLDDASALYEMLLESDAVEDVFVSESELATLLARFRARGRG